MSRVTFVNSSTLSISAIFNNNVNTQCAPCLFSARCWLLNALNEHTYLHGGIALSITIVIYSYRYLVLVQPVRLDWMHVIKWVFFHNKRGDDICLSCHFFFGMNRSEHASHLIRTRDVVSQGPHVRIPDKTFERRAEGHNQIVKELGNAINHNKINR